jgi:hypothetical protein
MGCGGVAPPAATTREERRPTPVTEQPTYPLRVARVSDAVLARAEAALRAETDEAWTDVRFDPYGGLLASASIVEAEPSAFPRTPTYDEPLMRERWSRFLAQHAARLALDAPGMTPIPERPGEVGFAQVWGGHVVGYATVSWHDVSSSDRVWRAARLDVTGHAWPVLPPAPAVLDADELAARLVGRPGTRVVSFQRVRQPCDPPGRARVNPCGRAPEPPEPPLVRVPHALTRADVIVNPPLACRYVVDGATEMELRLASDVMVRLAPAEVDVSPGFVARAGFAPDDPLPTRLDAVTGEPLDGACDR